MIADFVDGLNLENRAHRCTLDEVRERFGAGERMKLCVNLEHLLSKARECGFLYALIGGSFATAKPVPKDLDITWFGPSGLNKENAPCGCADMMDQQTSRDKFGHDFMYIPLNVDKSTWDAQLDHWGVEWGLDFKTNTRRGTLLLELV